ncbi:MAG: transposase [Planctomycetaceae bacterium]
MEAKRRHRKSYNEPGHAHELTFGCYRGFEFLGQERTCEWLAESVRQACDHLNVSLWAYVFMPDHAHLIVHPEHPEYSISAFLKRVKQPVSRKALAYLRRNAPHWLERVRTQRGKRVEHHFWQRGGGYDRNITDPRTLETMIEYLHLNPVRKALVERGSEWKWSSAGWFLGEEPNGLRPDPVPPEWTVGMSDR